MSKNPRLVTYLALFFFFFACCIIWLSTEHHEACCKASNKVWRDKPSMEPNRTKALADQDYKAVVMDKLKVLMEQMSDRQRLRP